MRNTRDKSKVGKFKRTEWLSKAQIQSFFSRLAATRRKERGILGISPEDDDDVQCIV